MALERKDVRAKLDPEIHAALKVICEIDDVEIGDFIEALIVPAVQRRMHGAMLLAEKLQRLGISGTARAAAGKSARDRESPEAVPAVKKVAG